MRPSGTFLSYSAGGEQYRAFVPAPLPPSPPFRIEQADYDLIEQANRALWRLDGVATLLPDISLFLYFYVRKEAVLSSQIEGTQSSLADLVLHESHEIPSVPVEDVEQVSNYVAALNHGLRRIREEAFPLSLRLIRETHDVLLAKGRGSDKDPGEFRRSQNWVGGTRPGNARFIPPPPDRVGQCMGELELFLHDRPSRTPLLMKTALAHVQFETIHPFLDGNGRMGRLLITLLLCAEGALREPLLYLSLFLKRNRQEYYERLQRVREESDWSGWLRFFLTGVMETAQHAAQAAQRILRLFAGHRRQIERLGRRAASAHRVHELLQKRPLVSVPEAARSLDLTPPTVRGAIQALQKLGLAREISGKRRNRVYLYDEYMKILDEGTEPIR
jgi:Fic family protein